MITADDIKLMAKRGESYNVDFKGYMEQSSFAPGYCFQVQRKHFLETDKIYTTFF